MEKENEVSVEHKGKESWLELRKEWRIVKRPKLEKGVFVLD